VLFGEADLKYVKAGLSGEALSLKKVGSTYKLNWNDLWS